MLLCADADAAATDLASGALALVAACAVAAVRWHGRAVADLEALSGRFGLAAALTPRARQLIPQTGDAHHERQGAIHLGRRRNRAV